MDISVDIIEQNKTEECSFKGQRQRIVIMVKLKVLEYNQNYMARIGIHSHRLNEPTNEFFKQFVTFYYIFVFTTIFIGSSAVFVYNGWPQMDIISEPCLIVIAGLQVLGMYLSIGLNMKKLKILHIELQGIIDAGKLF